MSKGRILSKSPCNADLFEGKAHEKLAKTIADEIVSDENCTIIGIDGGWGSGKLYPLQRTIAVGLNVTF